MNKLFLKNNVVFKFFLQVTWVVILSFNTLHIYLYFYFYKKCCPLIYILFNFKKEIWSMFKREKTNPSCFILCFSDMGRMQETSQTEKPAYGKAQ